MLADGDRLGDGVSATIGAGESDGNATAATVAVAVVVVVAGNGADGGFGRPLTAFDSRVTSCDGGGGGAG